MKLSLLERMVLRGALPGQSDLLTMQVVKNVSDAVSPTEAELTAIEYEEDKVTGNSHWDRELADALPSLAVEFTGPQTKVIVEALEKMDGEKTLTANHLSLCEKFGIGGK